MAIACSAIGWGVCADVAGHADPIRDLAEVDVVYPCGQQLDEPEPLGGCQQLDRNLAGQIPGEQDRRLVENGRPLLPREPLKKRDPGVVAEDLPVDPLEPLVHRVAHRHQRQVRRPLRALSRQILPSGRVRARRR